MSFGGDFLYGSVNCGNGRPRDPSPVCGESSRPARIKIVEEEFIGTPKLLLRLASRAAATLHYKIDRLDESSCFISFASGSGLRRFMAAPAVLQFEKIGANRFRVAQAGDMSGTRRNFRATRKILRQMRRLAR